MKTCVLMVLQNASILMVALTVHVDLVSLEMAQNVPVSNVTLFLSCHFPLQFKDDGLFLYPDINECSDGVCAVHSSCIDTVGSYVCLCEPGYVGDGFTCGEQQLEGTPMLTWSE